MATRDYTFDGAEITPRAWTLTARHPNIALDVYPNVLPVKLSQRAADIAIRVVRPSNGDYLLRRVGSMAISLYASPAYLSEHGEASRAAGLDQHRIIGWTEHFQFLPHVAWLDTQIGRKLPILRTSSMTSQFKAAKAGLGIAAVPTLLAEAAGLIRMVPEIDPLILELWLAMHTETQGHLRVWAVADYIIEMLAADAEKLNPFA